MKRTSLLAIFSVVVLMILVVSATAMPGFSAQASATMEVTVNGPGTVKMVVSGLQPAQEATLVLQSPKSVVTFLDPKKANGQGVIHATEALGNSAEAGAWTASAFVDNVLVASTTFTI